jgi:hypothetical protein
MIFEFPWDNVWRGSPHFHDHTVSPSPNWKGALSSCKEPLSISKMDLFFNYIWRRFKGYPNFGIKSPTI